ncbi:CPBP family intramembrane metalloprotease [Rossellomorea marisflavi]|uniref:CPBP family intramembrane glutamic endopeptidase n=1 Tax=Rossellomorea marisflavi TaxID=189381 RepID=UPI0013178C18|nr:CPBP family intramembrane glutamic endopeptidase [Rossellomorea marisflavi]QHA35395.1 CPBP family intramembrane metalloprotease [Rossellomorea marisflavi]
MRRFFFTFLKTLLFFSLWVVGILICSIPGVEEPPYIREYDATLRLWWELTPLFATLLASMVMLVLVEKKKLRINLFRSPARDVGLGLSLGIIWIGVALLAWGIGDNLRTGSMKSIPLFSVWLLAVLVNVIMQEWFVRGYLFQLIRKNGNTPVAIAITTLLFTGMHGGAFEAGIIPVINIVTMSIFVSLLLLYTGNLLAPIIAHFIWNAVGGLVTGTVSLAEDYPSLWNWTVSGSPLQSGGIAKLEGSIIVLVLNLFLITWMSWLLTSKIRRTGTIFPSTI